MKNNENAWYRDINEVTESEFRIACSTSHSIKELCRKLEIKPDKDSSWKLKELSFKYSIPLPIWKTRTQPQKRKTAKLSTEERLSYGRFVRGSVLKKIMIEAGAPYICAIVDCPLHKKAIWIKKTITLQVDHIDGDKLNNTLSNLRFLCPNCHSQTSTFSNKRDYVDCECGRRRLKNSNCPHRENGMEDLKNLCSCGKLKSRRALQCRECSDYSRRKL